VRPLLWALVAGVLVASTADATEPFDKGSRLGVSVGLPAGGNLEYSYELGRRALYLAGGWWGSDEIYGLQGGMTLERGGTTRKHFAVNLVAGHFSFRDGTRDRDLTYGGIEAYARYRSFFIAPQIALGDGSYSNYADTVLLVTGRLGFTWPL
jgi:hypothetical protein